jgi:nitrous oxidase accessory protein NosD
VTLEGTAPIANVTGIGVGFSSFASIGASTIISKFRIGIHVFHSSSCRAFGSTLTDNSYGAQASNSSYLDLTGAIVSGNNDCALRSAENSAIRITDATVSGPVLKDNGGVVFTTN